MDADLFPAKPKVKPPKDDATFDMFGPPPPNTRRPDHETSEEAASRINLMTGDLRMAIYRLIEEKGPMTAIEAEEMPCWSHLAPSTVRKRCSELFKMRYLISLGRVEVTTRDGRTTSSNLLRVATTEERRKLLEQDDARADSRRERGG
jgi:hypothetical protein